MLVTSWRCRVCGYIHNGPEPPEICPVCGVSKEEFEPVEEEKTKVNNYPAAAPAPSSPAPGLTSSPEGITAALGAVSYGLFVVCSVKDGLINGQTANTVFQITSNPPRIALGLNKNNLTHEYVKAGGKLSVTVLGKGNVGLVKHFGFKSGRSVDKFAGIAHMQSPETGCPVLLDGMAYLEGRVVPEMTVDAGSHTLFVAEVVGGGKLRPLEALIYEYYRLHKAKPDHVVDNIDLQNVVAALNLEYGANCRYEHQIKDLNLPGLNSLLEGVVRTEADHVQNNLDYAEKFLAGNKDGWSRALMYLKLNLEFEEIARETYTRFANQTEDPVLKELFTRQSRSEAGHVNIFRSQIETIEKGSFPVIFYCPLCGWEVDFGLAPSENDLQVCGKCGAGLQLNIEKGNFKIIQVR